MLYEVKPISKASLWEDFNRKLSPHTFLQSWSWGEQYEGLGSKIIRLGVYEKDSLIAVALFIEVRAKRGAYLLCPHGPLFSPDADIAKAMAEITSDIVARGRKLKSDFIRICPILLDEKENREIFTTLGYKLAPIHMHPELSWILDVSKPEEEILRGMRKTTRYLIKKSEKDGILVTSTKDPKDLDKFWPVYEATVKRQHFTPFNRKYLEREFKLFADRDQAILFVAEFAGEIVASAIIIFYGDSAFYHHSGSILSKTGSLNASYLLQWRVIQEAKKRGCTLYNFWGISPDSKPHHPWAGLSLFKKGFGGSAESYLHAQDLPLTWKYYLNFAVETVRRIRRGV